MFKNFSFLFFIALLIFGSCSKEEDDLPVPEEEIFMDFTLDGSHYKISNKEFELKKSSGYRACDYILNFVSGFDEILLTNPKEAGFIGSVNFIIEKKVFIEDLNLADSSDYTEHVLNADQFGFPLIDNGFFSVFDPENNIFEVPRNESAEAYLLIVTENEFYRSTSNVPNERDPGSYLTIDKVIKVDHPLYQYIVEGKFRVNLFKGGYVTESKITEGNFRWPVVEIPISELTELCK